MSIFHGISNIFFNGEEKVIPVDSTLCHGLRGLNRIKHNFVFRIKVVYIKNNIALRTNEGL